MTGGRVFAVIGLIVLATAVLPPAAAWGVNRSRVRLASAAVATLAETLRQVAPQLRDAARGTEVLCGPGRMPLTRTSATERWGTASRAALSQVVGDRQAVSADPWGNCYVASLAPGAAGAPATVRVLSAGPNGIIDTPFAAESGTPAGDDVGMRVR